MHQTCSSVGIVSIRMRGPCRSSSYAFFVTPIFTLVPVALVYLQQSTVYAKPTLGGVLERLRGSFYLNEQYDNRQGRDPLDF